MKNDYSREKDYVKMQEEIERRGWKIVFFMQGTGVQATRNNRRISAPTLHELLDRLY